MSSKPQSPKSMQRPPQPTLQERLGHAQMDAEKWSRIAGLPNLSPQAALVARNMSRSSNAAVTLGQKAMSALNPPVEPGQTPEAPSLQGPETSSEPM